MHRLSRLVASPLLPDGDARACRVPLRACSYAHFWSRSEWRLPEWRWLPARVAATRALQAAAMLPAAAMLAAKLLRW